MMQRCYNANSTSYEHYGGRGIVVCPRWKDSFGLFLEDMGLRPSPAHSINRRNNDGNYEPDNCHWATRVVQNSNRRGWKGNPRKRSKMMKRHPEIDKLLNEIAAYRLKTNLGRTQFGLIVANDGHFIKRLETGRMPRIPTIERVREIMARKAVKAK